MSDERLVAPRPAPAPSSRPALSALELWLQPLRRRATFALALRAGVAGIAALALSAAVGGMLVGPLPHAALLGVAWTLVASAVLVALWQPIEEIAALRGAGIARVLAPTDPHLAAATRSAFALAVAPPEGASAALVAAHQRSVHDRLGAIRPAAVVRIGRELGRVLPWAALALVLASVLALASGRARAGVFALVHPLATSRADAPTASIVDALDARIVYPTYLDRAPLRVPAATRIDAPIGSTVELRIVPRVVARRVELGVGVQSLGATRSGDSFSVSFLVREDVPLTVTVTDREGRAVRDAERRAVHAIVDPVPSVHLLAPESDGVVDPDDSILLAYDASDDLGVADAELVITPPDGRERRRRLEITPSAQVSGDTFLAVRDLGAEPGDQVALRVEARDANDVTGPGVGRSETRTIIVASESTRRQEAIEDLEAVRDAALVALADRLELPVPEAEPAAITRFATGSAQLTALIAALGRLSFSARVGEAPRTDAPLYAAMVTRLRRALAAERRGIEPRLSGLEARVAADRGVQSELEDDVLSLTDLLARARVEDAAEIARELEALRREIASLLRELERAPSDEARAALMTAIGRAEQRLAELRARLASMGSSAPSEFGNVTEQEAQQTQAALDAMREGLLAGDLGAADRALSALEQEIDRIANALGEGASSFAEAHFGERDRALAEAMDALQGLEAEERDLASGSSRARTEAAHAALETLGDRGAGRAQALAEDARSVASGYGSLDARRLPETEREERARAEQRLRDVATALSHGDLGEASHMAEEADLEADALARDLELEAMMFPGHEGQTASTARTAREVADRAHALRGEIDRAIPDLREHLTEDARRQLQAGATRQSAASASTERLAERFEHGPDGEPLVPDAAADLRDIRQLMDEARDARERQQPVEAADAEGEAARRLADLRQRLEEDAQHQQSRSGGGGGSELGAAVAIPEDHEGPMEARRRLLDAMSEDAPPGYGEAVRRYYEGLLR